MEGEGEGEGEGRDMAIGREGKGEGCEIGYKFQRIP